MPSSSQLTPNLQVLNFDGKVENTGDWAVERDTPLVIKRLWGSTQVDYRIPRLTRR
jgi:hypothetical protein